MIKPFFYALTSFMLCCLLLTLPLNTSAQKTKGKKIDCTADILRYDATLNPDIQILTGNVIFKHEGAICYADTAFYNEKTNIIEAFGQELIIHINDSTHLYGKYLVYDGNTKIITIEQEVMLSDEYSVLYTDKLTFIRNQNYGYYDTGGEIINDSNTLVSEQGWYYTSTKDVFFKKDVVLTTPDYTVKTDTLKYNTQTKIAYFLSPTHIYSDENTVYCEYGWYDTEKDMYQFEKNAKINTEDQELKADIIWYDRMNEKGKAYRNVRIFDSVENVLILGKYAEYDKTMGYAFITDSAIAILIDNQDSLFLHADSIRASFDSAQNVDYVTAHHRVLFYRDDIQGSCDSLVYWAKDSIIIMYRSPIVWFDKNQTLADTIRLFIVNKDIKEMHLIKNSFICEDVFTEQKFNQIKGLHMFIYFKNNNIDYVFVDAQAECLYYVLDESNALIGVNQSASKQMRINFENNEVSTITFFEEVKGDLAPEEDKMNVLLKDFKWLNQYRPMNKQDIFKSDFYKPELKKEEDDFEYDD
ncbi:MAG: OstA-like protein [Bacteroidales bacterium]|jgi:lipopolysaccharide export system protein LptA|nr:OstA-like protein [Bacteroidales bacterium]